MHDFINLPEPPRWYKGKRKLTLRMKLWGAQTEAQ